MPAMVAVAAALLTTPAVAAERDYCPARPGLGTPACTIAPGHVSVETALADWTRGSDAAAQIDDVVIGDTLVRVGITDAIEAQVEWTPYGLHRVRDKVSGAVTRDDGNGDVSLGAKINLHHPDGNGLSIAVQPSVSLPVGRGALAAGDWGASLVVPVDYDLGHGLSAQFTGEVDAAVNASGAGRHVAYGATLGLGVAITKAISTTIELQDMRDDDPSGAATMCNASVSLAWMINDHLQADIGGVFGLNAAAPKGELYVGVARRF